MFSRCLAVWAGLVVIGLSGCGPEAPTPGVSADVTGTLSAGGKPLGDVVIAFRPTGGTAQPTQIKTAADGTFSGKLLSGKYAWYLPSGDGDDSEGALKKADAKKQADAIKGVATAFKQPSMDRQVDVSSGTKLDLRAE